MENAFEIKNLEFSYIEEGEDTVQEVIRGLSFNVEKGQFLTILGPNGSGKSTLAKMLNGLILPTAGDILAFGLNTKDENNTWDIRSRVGMVFQNPDNQLVSSIVEDDVAFGPENLGVSPDEIRRRVEDALKKVDMYEEKDKGPHLLSGGQKQRVAIAGVLALDPECIIFDEPTAMLDPRGRRAILEIVEQLHKEGRTIILITHFMEEALRADRVMVLCDGKIAMDGSPKEIFARSEELKAMKLSLPFPVGMARALRKAGMNLPKDILTEEELIKAIFENKGKTPNLERLKLQ